MECKTCNKWEVLLLLLVLHLTCALHSVGNSLQQATKHGTIIYAINIKKTHNMNKVYTKNNVTEKSK